MFLYGACKTTILRIIMRILGAESGAVLLKGSPIRRLEGRRFGDLPEERGLYQKTCLKGLPPGRATRV